MVGDRTGGLSCYLFFGSFLRLFKSLGLGDGNSLRIPLVRRILESPLDPFSLFLRQSKSLGGFRRQDHATTLTPEHPVAVTYLILNLERDHVVAVAASAILSEFRDGHISGSGHDAVVDLPLGRIDSIRELLSVGQELLELTFRGPLLFDQLLPARLHFGQGLTVRLLLLLESLLQPLDLVQETQCILFFTLEGPPDHFKLGMYGRLLPHVPDRLHALLQLGHPDPPLFDRQFEFVLLKLGLFEPLFERLYLLLQPEHRGINFLEEGLEFLGRRPNGCDLLI